MCKEKYGFTWIINSGSNRLNTSIGRGTNSRWSDWWTGARGYSNVFGLEILHQK